MKKLVLILTAIAAVALFNSGCKRNEKRIADTLENVCFDSQGIGENTKSMAESLSAIDSTMQTLQPMQRPAFSGCASISWNATEKDWNRLPISKAEVEDLARTSSYGDLFSLEMGDSIVDVISTITVYQIHSDSPIQTIVFYEFKPSLSNKTITSMALIQGSYECKDFDNIKLVVNTQTNCCSQKMPDCIAIRFGGRFCKEPECVKTIHNPCNKPKSDCVPCRTNQQPTVGIKYDEVDELNVPANNARTIRR